MTIGQQVLLFFRTRVARAVILVVSLLIAIGIIRSVVTIYQKRGIVSERQAVLKAEEAKHAELERRLSEATSSAFVERVAREKLGLVRPGEQVVILDTSQSSTSGTPVPELSSWQQWWRLFF